MTITLTPEMESVLEEQARREGTTPEQLALDGLHNLFPTQKLSPDEILALAAQVYAGLSQEEIKDVEKIALDRSHFAGERLGL